MHQTRHRHVGIFATRIGQLPCRGGGLFNARHDLPANRTIRVAGINQIEEVWRNRQRQMPARQLHTEPLFLGQR